MTLYQVSLRDMNLKCLNNEMKGFVYYLLIVMHTFSNAWETGKDLLAHCRIVHSCACSACVFRCWPYGEQSVHQTDARPH